MKLHRLGLFVSLALASSAGAFIVGPSARASHERTKQHGGVGIVESLLSDEGLPGGEGDRVSEGCLCASAGRASQAALGDDVLEAGPGELVFKPRGEWHTFRTTRAAPSDGRWRYTYRFDGTHGTRRYRFRARIPRENGYPFSPGASRRVAVRVNGL